MKNSFTLLLSLLLFASIANGQTYVSFELEDTPAHASDLVGIRGSIPPLSWYETYPMEQMDGRYFVELDFSANEGEELEFKFVYQSSPDADVNWENMDNRTLSLSAEEVSYTGNWDEPYYRDPSTLPMLSVEALQADYALIETIFREVHPGTYRYLSEEELTINLAKLKETFSNPLSVSEAYLALNKFIATIKCGHTASPLYNQSADVTAMLFYGPDKLPFTFQWLDGRMIVELDATVLNILPTGTEILKINGYSTYDILKIMCQYVPSDGPANNPKDGMLSLRGYPWRYELFDAAFHLLIPPGESGYEIQYLSPNES